MSMMLGVGFLSAGIFFGYYYITYDVAKEKEEKINQKKKEILESKEREENKKKELVRLRNENIIKFQQFQNENANVYNFHEKVYFDENKKVFTCVNDDLSLSPCSYDKILEIEIIKKEDTQTTLKNEKSIAKSVAGQALFGIAAGVTMGNNGQKIITNTSITDLSLKIIKKDLSNPVEIIPFVRNTVVENWLGESNPFEAIEKLHAMFKIAQNEGESKNG